MNHNWQLTYQDPFFFAFILTSWRLITSQHCSEFCHTLTWISHGFTCAPHPDSPSRLPLYPIPLGLPSAPGPGTCLMHPSRSILICLPWWAHQSEAIRSKTLPKPNHLLPCKTNLEITHLRFPNLPSVLPWLPLWDTAQVCFTQHPEHLISLALPAQQAGGLWKVDHQ